jgi:hypothetical protein
VLASGQSKRITVPEEHWIKTFNHHPAYMSQEEQEEIKSILKKNRLYQEPRARNKKGIVTERIRQGSSFSGRLMDTPGGYRTTRRPEKDPDDQPPRCGRCCGGCCQTNFRVMRPWRRLQGNHQTLNKDGLRTAQGRRFASNHVYWILRNKAYVGLLEYNFRQRYGPVEPMTIPGFYPPIIDQQLFDRVQEKLRLSTANWQNSYANRTTYLLSRLVVCDSCGHRYIGTAAKGGKLHSIAVAPTLRPAKPLAPPGCSTKTSWRRL